MRSVLEYVPYFRGRLFAIWLDSAMLQANELDVLLDVDVLNEIGVRIVLMCDNRHARVLHAQAQRYELRVAAAWQQPHSDLLARCSEILARGQVAVVGLDDADWYGSGVELALGLGASKYMRVAMDGVPRQNSQPLAAILESQVHERLENVEHLQDLLQAAAICRRGIARVHLLDGAMPEVLLDELFSEEGVGTMVHADLYQQIRSLEENDIPEFLSMLGRSVQDAKLVERTYEDVGLRLADYYVLTIDDSIIGSVALHVHADLKVAEIACVYIKNAHNGRGYAQRLVEFARQKAKQLGCVEVFALTQSAVGFFRDHMGFEERQRESLPAPRLELLVQSGRNSRVFWAPAG